MKAIAHNWRLYAILFGVVELLIISTQLPLHYDTQPAHTCSNEGLSLPC